MNDHVQSVLTSYGPLGVFALVSIIGVAWFLRWLMTTITPRILGHFDKAEQVMDSTVKAINEMGMAVKDLVVIVTRAHQDAEKGRVAAVAELRAEIKRMGRGHVRRRKRAPHGA